MKEEIVRCDACGRVIDRNHSDLSVEVRTPVFQRKTWYGRINTQWASFDLCMDCWRGLQDVATALKCLQSTTQNK